MFILNRNIVKVINDKKKSIIAVGVLIVMLVAMIVLKKNYKIAYKVTLNGETIGYVKDKVDFTCSVTNKILNQNNYNKDISLVVLHDVPTYSFVLLDKNRETDEDVIMNTLKLKAEVTYKLYAITLKGEDKAYVESLEKATEKVKELTEKYQDKVESEFGVREVYTTNEFEYKSMKSATTIKLANNIENADKIEKENERKELEKNATLINGIAFVQAPVQGNISSRYGVNESVRNHTHKGLDICASNGTPIVAPADGVVEYASYNSGGYGNLVKISHGNGVDTYYGHCSKIYVKVGQQVKAGDTIAAVGSTGHSTGNHLHFEIRLDGNQVNPQTYLYRGM